MNIVLSPIPTIMVACANFIGSKYFGIPIYQFGLYYTGIALCIGFIVSAIGGLIGHEITKKNSSDGLAGALLFVIPTGIAFYKIAIFWATLFAIHNVSQFLNFLK